MALIPCIECGRDISDRAIMCPGCGRPVFAYGAEVEKNQLEVYSKIHEQAQALAYSLEQYLVFFLGKDEDDVNELNLIHARETLSDSLCRVIMIATGRDLSYLDYLLERKNRQEARRQWMREKKTAEALNDRAEIIRMNRKWGFGAQSLEG